MLRPYKQCKKCSALTRDASGYCDEHRVSKDDTTKLYDKSRDSKSVGFYNSRAWTKTRMIVMQRDNGLCQYCLREGRVTHADMVHHIIELKSNWMLRLSTNNLISLCNTCHNSIKHYKQYNI